ncbi:MAG TPA: FHA domain-containing protein [Aggregatilineales bacterium]|nr:FHA domain-containing protein [Aggregatilineales bacterium]
MSSEAPRGLARIYWDDPTTGEYKEYVLTEGSTVTIGRSLSNEISIREQHVSRQHAVINYQYGMFMISDLGSANGTFVNDKQLTEPFPLASGDVIRLYVPTIQFSGVVTEEDEERAIETGTFIVPTKQNARPVLSITTGPQEGMEFPIKQDSITLGRAVVNATWEIGLQDRTVSRPHARIEKKDNTWYLIDLGSANGTLMNNNPVVEPVELGDGSVLVMGQTTILVRFSAAD